MKKLSRLPHEEVSPDAADGLPVDGDVEGHFLPGLPGTGGDIHQPIGGEKLRETAPDDDDVEGHILGHTKGERFGPGMPGTGGDQA